MRIATWAKARNIPTHYYISPQIWAWKENRIKAIKRDVDFMYVILPFEKDFYEKKHHYSVHFVGHPLIDAIADRTEISEAQFRKDNALNQKPIIEITVNENAVIHFELWPEITPIACASVMRLAEKRIFDGRAIERLEPGFVLQPLFFDGVDPQIDIMIKPEFKTNPENAKITFHRGIVAMAGDPENSSGSQYYITLAASERLNGNFTVIGKVIDGWDEIERLEHVEVEEAIEPQSGFVYHRPVKTEMITKVRLIK